MKRAYIKPVMQLELVVVESVLNETSPGLSTTSAVQVRGMDAKNRYDDDDDFFVDDIWK